VLISALVFVYSCKKDDVYKSGTQTEILNQNDDFTENILSFIDMCKTLNDNPGIRNDDFIEVDAALLNLEAAMNLMYTYYIETSDYYTANSEIIINVNEEEEISETNGPLNQHIVNTHRNKIDSDSVIFFDLSGQLNLTANAICAGYKNRIGIIFLEKLFVIVQPKHPGKAAFQIHYSRTKSTGHRIMYLIDHNIVGLDTHPRLLVI